MNAELDHVFVCCDVGAPEASLLVQRGFVEGSPNSHDGQGTANRRFFFSNAYLELLWVNDPAEAQREDVLPTQLWERWSRRTEGACPFGIVFRPGVDSTAEVPFTCWSYRPPYLPSELSIEVVREITTSEPLIFYLPFARHRDPTGREPTTHSAGIDRIVNVSVTIPLAHEPSENFARVLDAGLLSLRRGPEYLLELDFEGEGRSSLDLRPRLPLLFSPCGPQAESRTANMTASGSSH
jgi:Glyoxalase-like domain